MDIFNPSHRQLKVWRLYYIAQAEKGMELGHLSLARMYLKRVDAVDALIAFYGSDNVWIGPDAIRLAVKN